jgi:hypothetical protein
MEGYSHRECTEKQSAINNLHYSKEKHKFEEAQRGSARKAKTARTEDDEDYVNTRSANIEDSSPMEGFAREGEGTDAQLWSATLALSACRGRETLGRKALHLQGE